MQASYPSAWADVQISEDMSATAVDGYFYHEL